MIDGISWEFPLFTVLYAIFVIVWGNHNQTAVFAICFCLDYVGDSIYWALKTKCSPDSLGEQFLIILPFSACQAWNGVILFLTAFEAFGVDATEREDGGWTRFFVVLALWVPVSGC